MGSFLINTDTTDLQIAPFSLYFWNLPDTAKLLISHGDQRIDQDWYLNEHQQPSFSKNGKSFYFGVNPKPIIQDTSLLEEEIVNVEVWSYTDKRLHTQQNVKLEEDRKKDYTIRYDIQSGSLLQLNDQQISETYLSRFKNEENYLVCDQNKYLEMMSWEGFPTYKDIYLVKNDGSKKLFAERQKCNPQISPTGKYIFYYNYPDSSWLAFDCKSGKKIELSRSISTPVFNEQHDAPSLPNPYGSPGWTKDDKAILIYDRYDVWLVDPMDPTSAKCLTRGRANKTSYRYIRLDSEIDHVDLSENMTLRFYDDRSGDGGIAIYDWKKDQVEEKIRSAHRYSELKKAKEADAFILRRENFNEFPDIEVCDSDFDKLKKISQANPQQNEYSWGNIEWFNWTAFDGQELRGLLVKPENFDPNKKYPLLVNFYERSSTRIHSHRDPYPHRSTINYTYYVNNGYLIFNPDVPYRIGYPGESAYNAVMSGLTALIAQGFIDESRIGVQGHSWGGYQVAHLVTKTDLFACAESGAPVVNMISAYGGIRWGSGLSRMFQYEKTQSRLGGTLWEKPLRYIENSPIFCIDKINTPVLIMHNDKDGAVPWYQGIEFFVAMRRLNKKAWMLNYNDEPHWPLKRQNRIDFNIRMQQFFDHYLKGQAPPKWMLEGVSAIDKGINQGLELEESN